MTRLDAATVHAALGVTGWRNALVQLGVGEHHLRNRHGPCPLCGGKDRFRFDNKGIGAYICGKCGAGDGLKLLQRLYGWDFRTALSRVAATAGISANVLPPRVMPSALAPPAAATPTPRALELLRTACDPADVPDVREYLASRFVWPLPTNCPLGAYVAAPYYAEKVCIGRFPGILAPIVDVDGELVAAHATWLSAGKKLEGHEPRKILGKLTARNGCAVRLMPAGGVLGIAEGIETALSAAALHGVPVWSALNAGLLGKFEAPHGVRQLLVFADRDVAGLEAGEKLIARLRKQIDVELCPPPAPHNDWNDALIAAKHLPQP